MFQYFLIGFLVLAGCFDLRSYKIPNGLIVIGMVIGLTASLYSKGWQGILESVFGIGFPIVLLFVLHQIRVLGAGDIKLFSVIGGMIGPSVWIVMLNSFLVGGVLVTVHMMCHHSLVNRLKWFWNYLLTCWRTRQIIPYNSGFDQGNTKNTIHFSIAVLIGYLIWLLERQVTV